MALKFGPQWLRDLTDVGTSPTQLSTPTMSVKFKLAEYRYGREEMLSLFNENSPPLDQVQKHLTIFSKEIQKPITLSPLTEDEQRLVSQGFNSTFVLRAAGRGSGPPLRTSRGGGTVDRSRGRGRGRGEGYILRPAENGDVGFIRPPQDGWEHVGRKFERSFSRGFDESGTTKREFSRSSSDNWRDKKHEDEDDDDGGVGWRNTREANPRWGPSSRSNWREPQRDLPGLDSDRRPPPPRRGFDQDPQVPHRTSESCDNEGEVPEWVEDDVGDDPGTFDSSGAFVSTKDGRRCSDTRHETSNFEVNEKKPVQWQHTSQPQELPSTSESLKSNINDNILSTHSSKSAYIPPNARNGTGDSLDSRLPDQPKLPPANLKDQLDYLNVPPVSTSSGSSNKGDGDSGFAFPNKEETNGTCAPPGQYADVLTPVPHSNLTQKSDLNTRTKLKDPDIVHLEKSLQNLVASMSSDHRESSQMDVSQGALPLTHENASKWFYKDPQGEIQGPFTNEEMSSWFRTGYFTMSLVIKRGCDDSFKQLGELIKRYGRVPFLPGPPLPPLITSIPTEPNIMPPPPLTIPSLLPSAPTTPLVGPGPPSVPDPLILQHMILQQEYLKQAYLMRQMQTLQMQEQENFKALSPDQQHLSMQMMMQTNPVFMQHLQQFHQQQLLLQQQQQEQQKVSKVTIPSESTMSFPQPQSSNSNATTATPTTNNSSGAPDKSAQENSTWGSILQYFIPGVWSQSVSQPTPQPAPQPTSLWDIDKSNGTLSPAHLAQLEKIKSEKKEDKLKEEERLLQDKLEKKQEEIRRQQEELERQRTQMRLEKEELERQKQIELQKNEEVRRQEEIRIEQENRRQQQKKQAEEKKRTEEEKKKQEEERKREIELKKQDDKKRKEEEKRKQQEDQKRILAEMKKKKDEEVHRQRELQQQEQEIQRHQELLNQQTEAQQLQREEEERMQKEAAERERLDAQKRQQFEVQRQQEYLRRLQQSQRDQLANIQLPPTSNWAVQQQNTQGSPTQSQSLTEIQEEEAKKEQEREKEQQQMQRMQEQVYLKNQQHQQKSWATHMSQGGPVKGVSLLDIQQQEQENAKKSQKDKPNNQSYQAKLTLASASTWTGSTSVGSWSNQPVWNSGSSNVSTWDQVINQSSKKSTVKESGEFPALKNQLQQSKKNSDKSTKAKVSGAKQKKEEETVKKLFQTRQQDDFSQWVMDHLTKFCAPIDVPTFVSFIVDQDSPDDVREYMKTYLGDTKESGDFARQFLEKRNYFRNQARLEKQQEEDSIWGPAPAVNPHNQMRGGGGGGGGLGGSNNGSSANEGGEGSSSKGKNRKKKQKMQKLDGSSLGFTVHADPNRKNAAGEVESIQ